MYLDPMNFYDASKGHSLKRCMPKGFDSTKASLGPQVKDLLPKFSSMHKCTVVNLRSKFCFKLQNLFYFLRFLFCIVNAMAIFTIEHLNGAAKSCFTWDSSPARINGLQKPFSHLK